MSKEEDNNVLCCFFISIIILGSIGWIMNIVSLIQHQGEFSGMVIFRVIGVIFAPLGAVLGYL